MAEVAVAIVSWNTRELLDRCLRSLQMRARRGLCEVWVLDNGSSDGSAALIREAHSWATLLEAQNIGFGAAVNRVAAATTTPWILAANADVEVLDGSLETLLEAARSRPSVGALAPRLILPDGSTQHSVHGFPTLGATLLFNLGIGQAVPSIGERLALEGHWNPDRAREVDWALGACLLIRRSAWEAVGGFDPSLWMYAEDLDLGWRMAKAGWSTRYEPGAGVHHASAAATVQAWGEERTEQWMLRRRGLPAVRAYAAINVAGAAVRAALLTPRARADPGRFAGRRAGLLEWARLHTIGLRPRSELARHR